MTEMDMQKIEELVSNEAFAKKLSQASSSEAVYQLLVDNGLDASYEDFMTDIQKAQKMLDGRNISLEGDELDPELLDMVSGGSARGARYLMQQGHWYKCNGHPLLASICYGLAIRHL